MKQVNFGTLDYLINIFHITFRLILKLIHSHFPLSEFFFIIFSPLWLEAAFTAQNSLLQKNPQQTGRFLCGIFLPVTFRP